MYGSKIITNVKSSTSIRDVDDSISKLPDSDFYKMLSNPNPT